MKPKIGKLTIARFRALRELSIDGLGRVNLITGRNNTGKSSVLEALRILAANGSPRVISQILHYREEDLDEPDEPARMVESTRFSMIGSLFTGFPSYNEATEPVVITAATEGRAHTLSFRLGRFSEQRTPDGLRRLVPQQSGLFGEAATESVPGLIVEAENGPRYVSLEQFRRRGARAYRGEWFDEPWVSCAYVGPQGFERTNGLGPLWDKIALSDQEEEVVAALQIISPDIVGISMIGGAESPTVRTAIARSNEFPQPVPLRSFGDGLNRLFGIVLSLVNARGGLLLIDEVENGLHHSVQPEVWRSIFRLARGLDIQVFATSHSWDCIEAFQIAATADPEEGALVRLSRKGDDVIPTLFREKELAVATRDRIEVR